MADRIALSKPRRNKSSLLPAAFGSYNNHGMRLHSYSTFSRQRMHKKNTLEIKKNTLLEQDISNKICNFDFIITVKLVRIARVEGVSNLQTGFYLVSPLTQ